MDSGYYAAMTGLVARTQALDTAAANLANAQTPGYRAEREFFRSVLLGPDAVDSQLGETVNNYGLLGGDRLSMAQGALEQTGNPLDLAIEGQGFFMVETPNGVALHAGRQLSPRPERTIGDQARRAGAVGNRPADSGSSGRGDGGRRWSGLGGRRGGGDGGSLHISRRNRTDARRRQPLCGAGGGYAGRSPRTHRFTRARLKRPTRMWSRDRWT